MVNGSNGFNRPDDRTASSISLLSSGKSEWGEERYFKITRKLYEDLEARLSASDYLAGKEYSIADIATWSWIARHKRHDIGLENFKGLSRWYVGIAKRPAVIKGFKALNKDAEIDYP